MQGSKAAHIRVSFIFISSDLMAVALVWPGHGLVTGATLRHISIIFIIG